MSEWKELEQNISNCLVCKTGKWGKLMKNVIKKVFEFRSSICYRLLKLWTAGKTDPDKLNPANNLSTKSDQLIAYQVGLKRVRVLTTLLPGQLLGI